MLSLNSTCHYQKYFGIISRSQQGSRIKPLCENILMTHYCFYCYNCGFFIVLFIFKYHLKICNRKS